MADDDKRSKRPGSRPAGARPFAKRGDGKPGFGAKPYSPGTPHSKKPFAKHRDEAAGAGGERPKRDFKASGAGKPGGGFKSGGSKPYAKRADGDQRSFGDRPARSFVKRERPDGDKPFRKPDREGADQRPGRRERDGVPAAVETRGAGEQRSPRPRHEGRPFGSNKPFGGKPSGAKPFATRSARPAAPRLSDEEGAVLTERIAKRLARAGIASRRDAEALIADGRVKVNGVKLTSPALNVTASDRIELDGLEIPPIERTRLFLFHKPGGVVTTNRDPEGRRTVFDVLPKDLPRLMTVGRLDINTEGLLLLTNDGGLARVLELPATGWLRRYRVRVHGKVDEKALAELKHGTAVDGVFYGGIEAALDREQGTNAWLTIGLREGKNREVKNILGALGLDVTRLIRISYGPFQLGELAEGAVQELKGRMLREQLGDRLIEEAGANFEAPVAVPFSNKPVRGEPEPRPEVDERPKIVRDGVQGRIGEGGLIKGRRRERDRDGDRTKALSKLTTRPDTRPSFKKDEGFKKDAGFRKGAKPGFTARGDKGKPDERYDPPKVRTSNVWMAPGARPQGKKSGGASDKPTFQSRERGEPSGAPKPRGGKPGFGKGKSGADRRR